MPWLVRPVWVMVLSSWSVSLCILSHPPASNTTHYRCRTLKLNNTHSFSTDNTLPPELSKHIRMRTQKQYASLPIKVGVSGAQFSGLVVKSEAANQRAASGYVLAKRLLTPTHTHLARTRK